MAFVKMVFYFVKHIEALFLVVVVVIEVVVVVVTLGLISLIGSSLGNMKLILMAKVFDLFLRKPMKVDNRGLFIQFC